MRKRGKVDGNHPGIVRDLRLCGYSVLSLADLGDGCPDLIVGAPGLCVLVEVKDPAQPASKRKLTDDEEKFHASWKGPLITAERTEDVIEWFRFKG